MRGKSTPVWLLFDRTLSTYLVSIENIHSFSIPGRFCLLISGVESSKLILIFVVVKLCCVPKCISKNFNLRPQPLEKYIPLDEDVNSAPHVNDVILEIHIPILPKY